MSAFLVSDKTISKILTWIDHDIRKSSWLKERFAEELKVDFSERDWQTKLGQKMWDLNQLSLGYRYGDNEEKLVYTFQPILCSPVQAVKSLQCWSYQCCEGEIPEHSKLYMFLNETVQLHMLKSIIYSLPEYDEAEWG